jgi:hypothetical protein
VTVKEGEVEAPALRSQYDEGIARGFASVRQRENEGSLSVSVSLLGTLLASILFACLFLLPIPGRSENSRLALEQPQAQLRVSGTLAKLDISAGKGMLMTDLEKPIFFRIDRPELFERLSIGDRVTMQLDEDGRVIKVIETLPAEVHEPPPPAK